MKALPLLIERAQEERDRVAAQAHQALQSMRQALGTLERLLQYRQECIARSPATRGRADGQMLCDYQRFVSRLDEAVSMQKLECRHREERSATMQHELVQSQQRLTAYTTLAGRIARTALQKETRKAQVASDEFAARAALRNMQEAWV